MEKIENKIKSISSIVVALILTIFIQINFNVSGNNIIFLFIYIANYYLTKSTFDKINRRKIIISAIISLLFAIVEIICRSISYDFTINNVINSQLPINFLGYFIYSFIFIIWIFNFFESNQLKSENTNKILKKISSNNIILFLVCLILIVISWIPFLLKYYPGILTPDSLWQIKQILGVTPPLDSHPIVHTLIVGVFVRLGLLISNDINFAIATYSVASMVIMALLNTLVIFYLRKIKAPKVFIVITLLYYMFYPVHGMYSITMWKDVFFSGVMPIFIILCKELIFNTESFLSKKRNIIIYIVVTTLVVRLRHNGFYVVLLTLPFIFVVLRKYWKKILPLFLSIIIIHISLNYIIYDVCKVSKGSVAEMLSIPIQHMARIQLVHRNELDEEFVEGINKFFIEENIGDYYYPQLSDYVKDRVNVEYFNKNKLEFLKFWIKVFAKYPKDCIEASISNSYGYYYPETVYYVVSTETLGEEYGIKQTSLVEGKLIENISNITIKRKIPIISMLFSIGGCFWAIVITLGYQIYKQRYKYILLYIPIFVLWLTIIASPVFCEFRYAYSMFMALPLFIAFSLKNEKNIR